MRYTQAVSSRARAEVPLLNQGNPEAAKTRVPCDRGAVNAASNDQEIKLFTLELGYITLHETRGTPLWQSAGLSAFNVESTLPDFGVMRRIFGVTLRTEPTLLQP